MLDGNEIFSCHACDTILNKLKKKNMFIVFKKSRLQFIYAAFLTHLLLIIQLLYAYIPTLKTSLKCQKTNLLFYV